MTDVQSLFIEIKPSKIKLYFFISVHVLAVISILLIDNYSVLSALLKIVFILLLVYSFNRCLKYHQQKVSLYLKPDNLIDINIEGKEYDDLQLSSESYISNFLLQLILLDSKSSVSQTITIFPDSIDAITHSQLRARLKLVSNTEAAVSV